MKRIIVFMILLKSVMSYGQSPESSISEKDKLLIKISEEIRENYIDVNISNKLDSLIKIEIESGNFNNISDENFAIAITHFLRDNTRDKHFLVKYLGNHNSSMKRLNAKDQQKLDDFSNSLENFGFECIKRLEGNIGYINFKGFAEPNSSKLALASAMNFVSNTNSLIVDLRENRGGDNGMLLLFCSYFFDKKTKLYDTIFRNKGRTIENWTKNKVLGKKYLNKKIYCLTSKNTFSAAEGMAYILQSYSLAKVIGEQTGGAANPVEPFFIDDRFLLLIPVGKVVSMVTNENWEQVGVAPDEKMESEDALKKAYIMALNEVLKNRIRTELSEDEIKKIVEQLKNQ